MNNLKFEDYISVIDKEIYKRKNKVHLNLSDFDFEDIAQIIRLHIYQKWHLLDPTKPVVNWVNVIISRQIKNFIRNNYTCVAPPCYKCPMNQGGNLCGFSSSGFQCSECPLYKRWEQNKKNGFNIKFASSLNIEMEGEQPLEEKIEIIDKRIDWNLASQKLSKFLRGKLPEDLYFVYDFLYVKGKTDQELAKVLGFKTTEKNRNPGYKQIYNFKQKIIEEAKKIIYEEEIV